MKETRHKERESRRRMNQMSGDKEREEGEGDREG